MDGTGVVGELLLSFGLPETTAKAFARERIDCETLVLLNEARVCYLPLSPHCADVRTAAPSHTAQVDLLELGVAPDDVVRVQKIIAAVNSELRDGESEESAAKRLLEVATSKPAPAAPEMTAGAPEAKLGAAEEKASMSEVTVGVAES